MQKSLQDIFRDAAISTPIFEGINNTFIGRGNEIDEYSNQGSSTNTLKDSRLLRTDSSVSNILNRVTSCNNTELSTCTIQNAVICCCKSLVSVEGRNFILCGKGINGERRSEFSTCTIINSVLVGRANDVNVEVMNSILGPSLSEVSTKEYRNEEDPQSEALLGYILTDEPVGSDDRVMRHRRDVIGHIPLAKAIRVLREGILKSQEQQDRATEISSTTGANTPATTATIAASSPGQMTPTTTETGEKTSHPVDQWRRGIPLPDSESLQQDGEQTDKGQFTPTSLADEHAPPDIFEVTKRLALQAFVESGSDSDD